jgi:predicted amidohydrolase YtcJ
VSSDRWLLRDVEIDGSVVDCRIADGVVAEVGTALSHGAGEELVDGRGGALLPGLADHHLHVLATAAATGSIDLRGASVPADPSVPPGPGWLRVVGVGAELMREDVDARWPGRPVRVQHRSGALWTLSSAAVEALSSGLTPLERQTGQLWRADDRLRMLLGESGSGIEAEVRRLGEQLASFGITHLMDASPDLDEAGMAIVSAHVPQKVTFMSEAGTGPRKLVLPDHAAPSYDELRRAVARCHETDRPVAVHAVSDTSVALLIAVLDDVGVLPGDRVEHAAMCDDEAASRLAGLGVVVVTQPTIFARRRDAFLAETPPEDAGRLWRLQGLKRAGVRVVVSSDAPYGAPDPGATIAASADRGPESLSAPDALASFLLDPLDLHGPVRRVRPGVAADLCLLADRLDVSLARAADDARWQARATYVNGRRLPARPPSSL